MSSPESTPTALLVHADFARTPAGGGARAGSGLMRAGLAVAALGLACAWALYGVGEGASSPAAWMLAAAATVGVYMAMNIGANDVANNMGPAVGSGTLSLGAALALAALAETLGALVAGGEVVGTIQHGIVDTAQQAMRTPWPMLTALLAAALWLNLATALGAPVSTTHAIVGAVTGAGVAAGGWSLVDWSTLSAIVASWVVSPLLGAAIAAAVLYAIKRSITWQPDMLAAAARVVPWLTAAMAGAMASYMLTKGLGALFTLAPGPALACGLLTALLVLLAVRPAVARAARSQRNDKEGVNRLFTAPLVVAAALLSFAHGANDVANAIGPLAAIHHSLAGLAPGLAAAPPLWILVRGGLGLALGLLLYGGRLIRTVGHEITELDRMRAYAIAMAAALTVILATQFGMPVSTTHVAIGAVLGVGFLRERIKRRRAPAAPAPRLVHRGQCLKIVAAWIVTVPATALLAGLALRLLLPLVQP
jgi:PiT family inorganic phosphate transporter